MRFLTVLTWLAIGLAQPAVAQVVPISPKLQTLEQRLSAMASENPGEYGIAAMDLATGKMVSFNGSSPFPMASTMKIAVAAAYLAEVDAGRRSLDDMVGTATAGTLMDAMITRSDNRATDLLIGTLGGPVLVDLWLRRHGLQGIRVDRNIAQLLSARRDLRDVRDSSTPTAMLGLLRLIDSGAALKPGSRAILLDMMARCRTGSNRIRGILPAGARVENKTGTLSGYTGDVGYLISPAGRRIAVAFFARGGENRPAVIATAARMIYDGFAAEQAETPSGGGATPITHSSTSTTPVRLNAGAN
jgi:beta-lactamase class A